MCYEERYYSEWAERASRRRREATHAPAPETREPPKAEPAPTSVAVPEPEPERVTENA
jgi:hypothetical protein